MRLIKKYSLNLMLCVSLSFLALSLFSLLELLARL